ncbi:MAG: hypothetical protein LBI96_01820 [Odoribacteraceae bacterium]|jgi:hypothetical protein|nr:hypothetical protein [Odoribacteraceae bacterium]
MKTYFYIIAITLATFACTRDAELGEISTSFPGYELPQGRSDADDRIVELYEKYGSYFLYDYTRRDLIWTFVTNSVAALYYCSPPDVERVGLFLDFIDDVWLDFYPDDFLREYLPYKIFLADTVKYIGNYATTYYYSRIAANQIALAFCSDTLLHLTPATKLDYKTWLNQQLWTEMYVNILEMPAEYFAITDYTKVTNNTTESPDYYRTRGFFQNISTMYLMTHQNDLYNFFYYVMEASYATLEPTLVAYPLLKRKYDIMRAHLIERYGVDIRQITDTTYE